MASVLPATTNRLRDAALVVAVPVLLLLLIARQAVESQLGRLHPPGEDGAGLTLTYSNPRGAIATWTKGKEALRVFEPVRARALVEQRSVLQVLILLVVLAWSSCQLRRRPTGGSGGRASGGGASPVWSGAWIVDQVNRALGWGAVTRRIHWVLLTLYALAEVVGIVLDNAVVRGWIEPEGPVWTWGRTALAFAPPVVLAVLGLLMLRPIASSVPPAWHAYRSAPASARLALGVAAGTFVLFNVSDIGAQLEDLLRREVATGAAGDVYGATKVVVAFAAYLLVIFSLSRLRDPKEPMPAEPWWLLVVGLVTVAVGVVSMWWWAWTSALATLGVVVLIIGAGSFAVRNAEALERRRALGTRAGLVLLIAGLTALVPGVVLGEAPFVWFLVAGGVLVAGGALLLWFRSDAETTTSSLPEGAAAVVLIAFAARAVMGPVGPWWALALPAATFVVGSAVGAWSLRHRAVAGRGRRALGAVLVAAAAVLAAVRPSEAWAWLATAVALVGLLLLLRYEARADAPLLQVQEASVSAAAIATHGADDGDGDADADRVSRAASGVLLSAAVLALLGLLSAVVRVLAATFATGEGDPVPEPLLYAAAALVVLVAGLAVALLRCPARDRVPAGWVIVIVGSAAVGPLLALLTLVPVDTLAADIGRRAGPFAVLISTVTWLTATFGAVRLAVLQRQQATLFQHLRFHQMPVIGLAVTWIALIVVAGAPLERIDATSHQVRSLVTTRDAVTPGACSDAETFAAISSRTDDQQLARELCRWITTARAQTPPEGGREELPLVLVTASGGGVRAAAWTMRVLDCLLFSAVDEPADGNGPCPDGVQGKEDRWRYLFAAGGASGGSVGIASAVAERLYPVPTIDEDGRDVDRWTRAVPEAEHVGGLATQMVAELGLAPLGAVTEHDRAEELIDSWAEPFGQPDPAACPGLPPTVDRLGFLQASTSCPGEVPLMLFNGTLVRTGSRFDISPLDAPGGTDPVGLRDVLCGTGLDEHGDVPDETPDPPRPVQDVPLLDAAFLSARFPFVTPSGRLGQDRPGGCEADVASPVDIVDGGYHDNSGAAQIARLYAELEPLVEVLEAETDLPVIRPILLRIENGEQDDADDDADADDGDGDGDDEAARVARAARLETCSEGTRAGERGDRDLAFHLGEPARVPWAGYPNLLLDGGCAHVVEDLVAQVCRDGHPVVRLGLYPHPGRALPLGWSLTGDVLDDMSEVIGLEANADLARAFVDQIADPGAAAPTSCPTTDEGGP